MASGYRDSSGDRDFNGYRGWSLAGWREHLPGIPDVGSFAAGLDGDTIPALAAASAAAGPGRVAVTVDGEPLTYARLDDGAARVAGWLAARYGPVTGCCSRPPPVPASSAATWGRSGPGRWSCWLTRAIPRPNSVTWSPIRGRCWPSRTLRLARILSGLGSLPTVGVGDLPEGGNRASGVVAGPRDTAVLAYTSGTTGRPKGVPLTHGQLAASIRSAMAAWRWSADDVLAHALPLYHQHGLSGLHAALIAGGTVHIRSRFSPAELIRTIGDTGATVLFGVPTIYQALMSADVALAPLRGLRLAVCGSAPLNPALAQRLAEALGRVPLIRYGTTETGLDVSNPVDDRRGRHGRRAAARRAGQDRRRRR